MTNRINILILTAAMLLSGCSLYRKYEPKETVPDDIMGDVVQQGDTLSMGAVGWRELFTDPLLQQLIERALENNTDVRRAQISVEQAQNDLRSARLGYVPTLSFEPEGALMRFNGISDGAYIVPLRASWQMNIFGQVTSRKRQARARREMQADYKQAVQAELAANVAASYYHLVMLDRELQILEETQVVWEKSLESMRVLYEAGLYQSPAVYQMEASLSTVRSGIVEVRSSRVIAESALCQLLSEPPHHIERAAYGDFVMPERIHVGLPVRLLQARPDVRQAARAIEVAYYDTQQARQSFFPDITLDATLGWSNGEGTVNPAQLLAKLAGSLVQPIFMQGRLKARYKNAKLEQERASLQFAQVLLNAGNEVYKHLHICKKTEEKSGYLASTVRSLHEAYVGTRELMNNGTNTYVEVLKAQEDLLSAQITEVENRYEGIQALINLYNALGGF